MFATQIVMLLRLRNAMDLKHMQMNRRYSFERSQGRYPPHGIVWLTGLGVLVRVTREDGGEGGGE